VFKKVFLGVFGCYLKKGVRTFFPPVLVGKHHYRKTRVFRGVPRMGYFDPKRVKKGVFLGEKGCFYVFFSEK